MMEMLGADDEVVFDASYAHAGPQGVWQAERLMSISSG